MDKYRFTQGWFLGSEIRTCMVTHMNPNEKHTILEIGSFEGLSSVFFADNFLHHKDSTLKCVDPFLSISDNDHSQWLSEEQEKNFRYNTEICDNAEKITLFKMKSDEYFTINSCEFDFIYIDGCHHPENIKRDMENSWNVLKEQGIMWMDDYRGGDGISIKKVMDEFVDMCKECVVIHSGYQLAIRKS